MNTNQNLLLSRREFLFMYDIKMGNPNGDPDENRPRVLPDGTYYVTDVRLKRFIRDYFKSQGKNILVDTIEKETTNLTGRVADYLEKNKMAKCEGEEIVKILLDSFIDARLFGSSFAFKKQGDWEPKPIPKTMTGAVQINHGEVLHQAQEVDIHGTSVFGSSEEKGAGTFTTYHALRYALIGFNGVANEHSAQISQLSEDDYSDFIIAMWNSVRSAGNTRTKIGQVPRLLINVQYKQGIEFQYGMLTDYVKLTARNQKPEIEWSCPEDYLVDLTLLRKRLIEQKAKIDRISYCVSPDLSIDQNFPTDWSVLKID
jgi:CRISPR-associated protein Csh2